MTWYLRLRLLLLCLALTLGLIRFSLGGLKHAGAAPAAPPAPPPPEVVRKIEPALLKALLSGKDELTPFIALLSPSTLPAQPEVPDRITQRVTLVRGLRALADQTQGGVRALLNARQQEGRAAQVL